MQDRHALIVGTDREACAAAAAPGVACLDGSALFWPTARSRGRVSLPSGPVDHGTPAYARLMHVKARPCLEVLRRGYSLIFTDTDVVFLRDPREDLLSRARLSGADLLIQSDHDESNHASCSAHTDCWRSHWCNTTTAVCDEEACGGFYWARPGPAVEQMFEAMFARFEAQPSLSVTEQPVLNFVLYRASDLQWSLLPRAPYPNGASFFTRGLRPKSPALPWLIHNNWARGAQTKKNRFEDYGLWLLNARGRCMATAVAARRPN